MHLHFSKRTFTLILILSLFIGLIFIKHLYSPASLISSPSKLATLLASDENNPEEWKLKTWPEAKYRILFHGIISYSSKLLGSPFTSLKFYWSFVFWSFIFTFCTVIAFFWYLKILTNSNLLSFLGCLFFIFSYPIIFAYDIPVWSREEPLAFLIVTLGMISIVLNHPALMSIFSSLGILTRETTLIIIICYFIVSNHKLIIKILYILPALLMFISIRFFLGLSLYDPSYLLKFNLSRPIEQITFIFLAFGFLWFLSIIEIINQSNITNNNERVKFSIIYKSAPYVIIIMLVAVFFLSKMRENRIIYILFPWIIPLALIWLKNNFLNFIYFLNKKILMLFIFGAFAIIFFLNFIEARFLLKSLDLFENFSRLTLNILLFHVMASFLCFIFFLNQRSNKKN